MRKFLIWLISFYQRWSALGQPRCRFLPTCSGYTKEAVERFGVLQGMILGAKRLCKCHPFHAGGWDPVPDDPH